MPFICQEFEQLNGLILPLTQDYRQNKGIHIRQLRHRDIGCCEYAELMHNGNHPSITIIYILPELEAGARVIISQLRAHFPNQEENNEDDEFIFTCPGCRTPFSEQ